MFLSNGPLPSVPLTHKQSVLVAISNYAPPSLRVIRVAKGQIQVKKKAFKINANIEDVGLNED